MMSISSQLLQPVYIDINITYDLDMSKFPGLDDPQHMYQPALLIESPESWSTWMSVLLQRDGVVEDTRVTSIDDDDSNVIYARDSQSIEEDLYTLIDSCNLSPPCPVTENHRNDGVDTLPFDGGLDLLEWVCDSLNTDVNICQRTGCFQSENHQDNYPPGNVCYRDPWPLTQSSCNSAGEWSLEHSSTKSCCVDGAEWFREQCSTLSSCDEEWLREQRSTESCGDAVEWFREQCTTVSSCREAAQLFGGQCSPKSSCDDAAVWFRKQCSTKDMEQSCCMKAPRLHYLRLDDEVANPRMPMDVCRTRSLRES